METQNSLLNNAGFTNGRKIYLNGGNSNSFAVLSMTSPLIDAIAAGTAVTGTNSASGAVTGTVFEAAAAGTSTLKVLYAVGPSILQCTVGGLTITNTTGCKYCFIPWFFVFFQFHVLSNLGFCLCSRSGLTASGSVSVGSSNLGYSYNVTTGNQNGRSMRKLISDLNIKSRVNENITAAFYPDFKKVSKVTDR